MVTTKKWFRQIEPETVASWTQLSRLFMRQFHGTRKYTTPPPLSRLASIKQGSNETLKAYVRRFNEELSTIHNPQENGVLMATILGVRPKTPFRDKLQKDECKMLQEFYRQADKIMHLEIAGKRSMLGGPLRLRHRVKLHKQENPRLPKRTKTTRNIKTEIVNDL